MASKNMILKRKIGNDIFELFPKTTDGQVQVTYGESMTLAAALASVYTDVTSWNNFKAGVDFAGQDAALDTLRELIDMISDADVAGSIAAKLAAIDTEITGLKAADAAMASDIADNTASIGNNATAIAKNAEDIATNTAAITAVEGRMDTAEADIDAAEAATTALTTRVAANETAIAANTADITAVEGRVGTNETDIAGIKTSISNLADESSHIYSGATVPEGLTENDLFIEILA